MKPGDRVAVSVASEFWPATLLAKWPDRRGMNPNRYRSMLDCGGVIDTWHSPSPLLRRHDPRRTGRTIRATWGLEDPGLLWKLRSEWDAEDLPGGA